MSAATKSPLEKYRDQVKSLKNAIKRVERARTALFPVGQSVEFLFGRNGELVRCRGEVSPHQFVPGDCFGHGADSICLFVDEPVEGLYVREASCKCHPGRKVHEALLQGIQCAEWGMDRPLKERLAKGGAK